MIDEPSTDTASASAVGSSGTLIVASGRVCSDRAPTVTVVGRSKLSSTVGESVIPVAEIATSGVRINAFVTPLSSMKYVWRWKSIDSLSRATSSPSLSRSKIEW
ncbi:hypothetical protein [Halorubrum kocurii]|uniref:hypothetical protein n=1 Tax=Halorubrum kocurii TaxID=478441 RepID=UPI001F4D07F8|nr:hypothetical protein [Halorubrum kocurii]